MQTSWRNNDVKNACIVQPVFCRSVYFAVKNTHFKRQFDDLPHARRRNVVPREGPGIDWTKAECTCKSSLSRQVSSEQQPRRPIEIAGFGPMRTSETRLYHGGCKLN